MAGATSSQVGTCLLLLPGRPRRRGGLHASDRERAGRVLTRLLASQHAAGKTCRLLHGASQRTSELEMWLPNTSWNLAPCPLASSDPRSGGELKSETTFWQPPPAHVLRTRGAISESSLGGAHFSLLGLQELNRDHQDVHERSAQQQDPGQLAQRKPLWHCLLSRSLSAC